MGHELLEPIDEMPPTHRASTEGSMYAEDLVLAFVKSGAAFARVRVEKTKYDLDALYDLSRRVCNKNDFKRLVSVHKNNGRLIFKRLGERK